VELHKNVVEMLTAEEIEHPPILRMEEVLNKNVDAEPLDDSAQNDPGLR